jgi:tetratricopeptide (TPR) repeat protein
LTTYIEIDSLSAVAYWQRAVCQSRLNEFNASQGTDVKLQTARVLADLTEAIRLNSSCCYLYYNRANVYILRHDYQHAVDDYNRALELDANLAEAYYNRGLVQIALKQQQKAIADLSKAGELGLYSAYSIIKQSRK